MTERLLKVALLGSAWVLYVLLFLSVLSFSVIVERWLYFRRLRDDVDALRKGVLEAIVGGDPGRAERLLDASPSVEARVIGVGLSFRQGGTDAVSDAIDGELERRKHQLERGANLLGTLGNNAPFVGLFGTVLGVIEAFHHLGDGRDGSAMGSVMGAIAEALVATGVGIFVAIPAVVAYNWIQQRVGDIEASVSSFRKLLVASLRLSARVRGTGEDGPEIDVAPSESALPDDEQAPEPRRAAQAHSAVAVEA